MGTRWFCRQSWIHASLLIFLNIRLLFSSLISHQIVAHHTAENLRGQAARKRVNNSSSISSVNMIFFGENSRKVLKSAINIRSCASIKKNILHLPFVMLVFVHQKLDDDDNF